MSRHPLLPVVALLVGLPILAGLVGCSQVLSHDDWANATGQIASLTLHNLPSAVSINDSAFNVTATDQGAKTTSVAWTSSDPSVAAIDASGLVTPVDLGTTTIRAQVTSGGTVVSQSANLVVSGGVTTLAGSGAPGSVDGTGTGASFNSPSGVAVDSAGNLYVADTNNNKIRKITAGGVVTTLAGTESWGSADGTGTAASFDYPRGVAVDGAGSLFVADTINNKIRKITTGGVVTTLAGSGASGSVDGTGTGASFNSPSGVAVDSTGNLYVADTNNNKIRKITAAGVVTTLAGSGASGSTDGTGTATSFYGPFGVALDSAGNLYVTDKWNNKIRKITGGGVVTTLAGSGYPGSVDGTGTAARFSSPSGVAVDSEGNLYVADTGYNKIRKITAAGVVTTLAGSGASGSTDGTGTAASFFWPQGVAVDSVANLYVADTYGHKIRKIQTKRSA